MRKPSFFQRITGAAPVDEYDDLFEAGLHGDDRQESAGLEPQEIETRTFEPTQDPDAPLRKEWPEELQEDAQEGELAVDVYQTPDHIILKALVAGVNPNSIDISLTRDMITIRGNREEHKEVTDENYFYKELYWGSFSRTILLPEEVDVDLAEANTHHGILMIKLPKVNKERKTKLKVKTR